RQTGRAARRPGSAGSRRPRAAAPRSRRAPRAPRGSGRRRRGPPRRTTCGASRPPGTRSMRPTRRPRGDDAFSSRPMVPRGVRKRDAVRADSRGTEEMCVGRGRGGPVERRRCAVLDPAGLYEVAPDAPHLDEPVLLVALDGFVDAGNAARLAVEALVEGREPRLVARFDVDQLVDYRSRRPPLRFETDHWAAYSKPELDVVALTDTADTGYLLLSGPEPDMQWERFCAAVEQIVRRFGIRLVINMTAIPMAVPHTRPIGVTVHGTRPELTEGHEAWFA